MPIYAPYVIERSSRGERSDDIFSRLLMDRIVFLGTPINDDVASVVIAQLLFLEAEDPELVESIRRLMFVFEDILQVQDQGIQTVLKEVENDELALALKTASDDLKDKLFGNMSDRASELITIRPPALYPRAA